MVLPVIEIRSEDQEIFAPYSGIKLWGEGVDNYDELEKDPTLLFHFCEETGEYSFLNSKLLNILELDPEEDETRPEDLIEYLSQHSINGGMVIHLESGWSGSFWIAFGILNK